RYPVQVREQEAALHVRAPLDADALARLEAAAALYRRAGSGGMAVDVPGRDATDSQARAFAQEIGARLVGSGLAPSDIALSIVLGTGQPANTARVAFHHAAVALPQCGDWSQDLYRNYANAPSANFGCAIQRNIGAMVSNPRDLLEPRAAEDPGRDGNRMVDVVTKYRAGLNPHSLPISVTTRSGGGGGQ
ncbi:MAG: CpaD family pilus assembly protein, partial [Rhodospirillales bacterium]|nr:CpaD family pilus assembly protein [Rhodospirillales bacterium]